MMENPAATHVGAPHAFTVPHVQALHVLYGMALALVKASQYRGELNGYLVPTQQVANLNTAIQRVQEKMKGAKLHG